jgi:hypothetical protein
VTGWDVIQPVLTLGLSVSSLVVAAIALGEASRNGAAQRRHNELSVKPLLHTWIDDCADNRRVTFILQNNGIGPAVITKIVFFAKGEVDGRRYPVSMLPFLLGRVVDGFFKRASLTPTHLADRYALQAGSELLLLKIDTKNQLPASEARRICTELQNKISCYLEYETIYGDVVTAVDP